MKLPMVLFIRSKEELSTCKGDCLMKIIERCCSDGEFWSFDNVWSAFERCLTKVVISLVHDDENRIEFRLMKSVSETFFNAEMPPINALGVCQSL